MIIMMIIIMGLTTIYNIDDCYKYIITLVCRSVPDIYKIYRQLPLIF